MTTKNSPTRSHHTADLRSAVSVSMTEDCWLESTGKMLHAMFDIALLCVHCQSAINTDFNEIGHMCTQLK